MPLPTFEKKNAGWQVQISLPVSLDPCLRLSPIRLTIFAMPAIEARRKAVSFVSASELQEYANEISWLPPTASSAKGYRHENVKTYIASNKKAQGRGLSATSIRDGRISHLKAIIVHGCEDNDQQNRVANTRIRAPDRASTPVKHKTPEPQALSCVLNVAVDTDGLTTPLMLTLGTLTGRRVSLLTMLRREALVRWHDVYVIEVETHRYENGVWIRVPLKTDE